MGLKTLWQIDLFHIADPFVGWTTKKQSLALVILTYIHLGKFISPALIMQFLEDMIAEKENNFILWNSMFTPTAKT